MTKLSLLVKLNLLFLSGVVVISIITYLIYLRLDYREEYFAGMRFNKAAKVLREALEKKKPFPTEELKLMDLEVVKDPKTIDKKRDRVISIPIPQFYLGVVNTKKGQEFAIKSEEKSVFLKDISAKDKSLELLFAGYAFALVMLILFYISIFRSIYPIKALEEKVKKFGKGDFNVDCSSDRSDEIGNLANSFDSSIKKIKALMDGRMLFLRNAAHELKTPLTKGMIALELPDSPKKTGSLKGVFQRLNTLISELLDIEKITSGNIKPVKAEHSLISLVFKVEDLLLIERDSIRHNIKNEKLYGDLGLLTLAVKNLVDNGIKYSIDKSAEIEIKEDRLSVKNRGEKIERALEYYLEPFSKENENQQGFGLGLFIVNHILATHNTKLEYDYKEGISIFSFKLPKT